MAMRIKQLESRSSSTPRVEIKDTAQRSPALDGGIPSLNPGKPQKHLNQHVGPVFKKEIRQIVEGEASSVSKADGSTLSRAEQK